MINTISYNNLVLYIFAFILTFFVTTKSFIPNAGFSIIAIVWLFYNCPLLFNFNKELIFNRKFIIILIFFLYLSIHYFFNFDSRHVDDTYIKFPFVFVLYFVLVNLIKNYNLLSKMVLIHCFVVIPIVLFMAYRSYYHFNNLWLSPDWETGTRFGKNTVGMFLVFCFTYLYGYLQKNKLFLTILGLLIIGACALYTISRGTLISITGTVLLFIIVSKRKKLYIKSLATIIFSFFILNYSFGFNFLNTFIDIKNIGHHQSVDNKKLSNLFNIYSDSPHWGGYTQRASHYVSVAKKFPDRPLFGHGMESFRRDHGTLAHNDYLTVIYEYGIIGIFLFLYILFIHFRDLFRLRKRILDDYRWLAEAQIVQLFILLFTFLIMTSYTSPITWYTLALSAVVVEIGKEYSGSEIRFDQ